MNPSGIPLWCDGTVGPSFPTLSHDLDVDVAIVGAGIVGLHCAWQLRESGLRCAVLEAREVGKQATGRSSAKVTSQHGTRYRSIEKDFDRDGARLYAQYNQQAVDTIASIASRLDGGAGLEARDAFVYATTREQAAMLAEEAATAAALGLPASIVDDAGLAFETTALLRYGGQFQFDPYAYLCGLAWKISTDVPVFEHSRVVEIDEDEPCRLSVNGCTVRARHVVLATQMPIVSDGLFFAKAFPFAHPVAAAPMPAGARIDGMFYSAGSTTRSFRAAVHGGERYLVVVGAEFAPGVPADQYDAILGLRQFLEDAFGVRSVSHLWINEDFRPMDGIGFVGPAGSAHPSLLVAVGFDGWGISQGVVAAEILADRILGRVHPAAELFDATRVKPVAAGAEFVTGNASAAGHLVGDRLLDRTSVDIDRIDRGDAGVVVHDGEHIALRRDESGAVTALSAVCTHMGCIVAWNAIDRTWDCPCHGSRFDEEGDVLSGPAVAPLERRAAPPEGRRR